MAGLGVVLTAELIAIALALARQDNWLSFLSDVGRTSFVLLWLALTSSALLCILRPRLAHRPVRQGTLIAWVAVQINVIVVSEILYWIAFRISPEAAPGQWLPADHVFFAARNVAVSGILVACVLRYFYVADQWQRNVRREAESRIHALQARIRPHFLFNSMNTIASLTRTNPEARNRPWRILRISSGPRSPIPGNAYGSTRNWRSRTSTSAWNASASATASRFNGSSMACRWTRAYRA
jgi:two-component system, LytTR family, sensor histidine kinase AlgZ